MWRLGSLLELVCVLQYELNSVVQLDFALCRKGFNAPFTVREVTVHPRDSDQLLNFFTFISTILPTGGRYWYWAGDKFSYSSFSIRRSALNECLFVTSFICCSLFGFLAFLWILAVLSDHWQSYSLISLCLINYLGWSLGLWCCFLILHGIAWQVRAVVISGV